MTTRNGELEANFEEAPKVANLGAKGGGGVRVCPSKIWLLAADST